MLALIASAAAGIGRTTALLVAKESAKLVLFHFDYIKTEMAAYASEKSHKH